MYNVYLAYYILYLTAVIFTLSGAVNAGFSLYFMAIPFMALMVWVSNFRLKNKNLFYFSIALIVFSIGVSHTQTKNPILFPVIGGYIEILEHGYQRTYSDGSGGFSLDNEEHIGCTDCGEPTYTAVQKGEKFKVLAVRLSHSEFVTDISLVTEIGEFSYFEYHDRNHIKVNEPVRAKWAERFSRLMAWPLLFFIALSAVDKA